jgi:hypothetical protein
MISDVFMNTYHLFTQQLLVSRIKRAPLSTAEDPEVKETATRTCMAAKLGLDLGFLKLNFMFSSIISS